MNKSHSRKKRRQRKAVMRHGSKAKPTHKAKTGRTGQIMEKQLRCPSTKNSGYKSSIMTIAYTFKNGSLIEIKIGIIK